MDKLIEGKKIFDIEIKALQKTKDALDETFVEILDLIMACQGKVIITGMGKPGHIAKKLTATFASLGTPAFCLHPGEAMHGDLGMITKKDIVIAISYSGESDEIIKILSNIKLIGATLIAITGNANSTLTKYADIVQVFPPFEEACHLGLAPTSSTTATLCYGDALAVVASMVYGFKKEDFGKFHPAGALGKKLILKVDDLMVKDDDIPKVCSGTYLKDAIPVMTKKGLGFVSVVNKNHNLIGIVTDGDLRRLLEKHIDIYNVLIDDVMTKNPKSIKSDLLAIDALQYLKNNNISNLPVVDENKNLCGTITWKMIVKVGIVV